MSLSEATALYKECTKYGSDADPRVPYSLEDCARLSGRIDAASWAAASKYHAAPVGQPILH